MRPSKEVSYLISKMKSFQVCDLYDQIPVALSESVRAYYTWDQIDQVHGQVWEQILDQAIDDYGWLIRY